MRSHPPSLLSIARRTAKTDRLFDVTEAPRGPANPLRVMAAVSGGPDSMALLHVLARLRADLGFDLHAHGVDHGLREEAPRELDLAHAFADTLEVPWGQTRVEVPSGGNLQARARVLRLAALRDAAARASASRIATAHHADDRAETVLLRLLRGASPAGLAVLPPRDGDLVRPLVRARRRDIEAHLHRHDIAFASDPSNLDSRFLRVRVRQEVIPLLEALSPGIVGHLNGLADDLCSAELESPRGAYLPPLAISRSTRVAIAALGASGSMTGRVRLPHGLVVALDSGSPVRRRRSPE